MLHFTIGSCRIKTTIPEMRKFLNDVYYHYHKQNKAKQTLLDDSKFPILKITSDIFSVQLWVKDKNGEEHQLFIDGDVFLNQLTIHTLSLKGENFSEEAVNEFLYTFKLISDLGTGYIYYDIDGYPNRLQKGETKDYSNLIDELYEALPTEEQLKYMVLIENLKDGFSPALFKIKNS